MLYDQQDQENRENQEQPVTYTGRHNEYVQGQLLGKGAYGKVFLVRNYHTSEEYALKRIQVPVTADGVPQSVLREITTMQQFRDLDHPNVLKLHDVFHNFGQSNRRRNLVVNMVVPKCDWDLYIFLRSLPRDMPENQSKMMARQMFSGIDYLHSMNIVHRDIKPQNILVNKDLSIKLADFGLSRGLTNHSAFTTVVVTLWYRSPELLLQTPYNSAVDIWAAGCILSELYAREALFPGQTEAGQLSLIFNKLGTPTATQWPRGAAIDRSYYGNLPCQPMEKINPKISQQAAGLVRRCLEYNALSRCTAAEALTDPYFFEGGRAYRT